MSAGICRLFAQTGACRFGNSCRFLHSLQLPPHGAQYHHDDSGDTIQEPLFPERVWCTHEADEAACEDTTRRTKFRFVSYNVLADKLAHEHARELYQRAPPYCLEWQHRSDLIVRELLSYDPDIICLQEVDHFGDLRSALQERGYSGTHLQRTGDRVDGCATFWRSSLFKTRAVHNIRLAESGLRDNVALLLLLEPLPQPLPHPWPDPPAAAPAPHDRAAATQPRPHQLPPGGSADWQGGPARPTEEEGLAGGRAAEGGRHKKKRRKSKVQQVFSQGPLLLVGNTHILFNTKRGDIKLGQLRTILGAMGDIAAQEGAREDCPGVAAMLAGDFNLVPGSGLYDFISRGSLHLDGLDRRSLSGQQEGFNYNRFISSYNPARHVLTSHRSAPPSRAPPAPVAPVPHRPRPSSARFPPPTSSTHRYFPGPSHSSRRPPARSWQWTDEELTHALGSLHLASAAPSAPLLATHSLKLLSSYHAATGSEPCFTTCHSAFMGTVDFIWFTPEGQKCTLRPLRVLHPPDPRGFRRGMPTPNWPSDHVALVADYVAQGTSAR